MISISKDTALTLHQAAVGYEAAAEVCEDTRWRLERAQAELNTAWAAADRRRAAARRQNIAAGLVLGLVVVALAGWWLWLFIH